MDILSEVLHVVQLKSQRVTRVEISEGGDTNFERDLNGTLLFALRETVDVVVQGESFVLGQGDSVLIPGGIDARIKPKRIKTKSIPAIVRIEFTFDQNTPHPIGSVLGEVGLTKADNLTDRTEMGRILTLLDEELVNRRMGNQFIARRFADILLVELMRRQQQMESPKGFFGGLRDPAISKVLAALHQHPRRAWNLASLGQLVGLSSSAIAERFLRHVGIPPLTYLRHWRLVCGRKELLSTGQSVKAIAVHMGYQSTSGFSKAFKNLFGFSPRNLREQAAADDHSAVVV